MAAARWFTVLSMILGIALALALTDATQAFNLLLLLGAGTGLIYILRWFWWRINAMTEIVAMVSSLIIAGYFTFIHDLTGLPLLEDWQKTVLGALLTTITWVVPAYVTPATSDEKLIEFYQKIRPGGPGWKAVIEKAAAKGESIEYHKGQLPLELLSFVIGCFTVYAALFASGYWIYGQTTAALIASAGALIGGWFLFRSWGKLQTQE